MSSICRSALSSRLHIPKERLSVDLSLYLVANRPSFQDEDLFFSKIMAAVKGGVCCVQLRDYESDFATAVRIADRLKMMLKVPLFINTLEPLKVTQEVGADGIYLEEPIPYSVVRKALGEKAIIGAPLKTMEEVLALEQTCETQIDYFSMKALASTCTCPRNDQLWGMEGLRKVRSSIPYRIVAIGGINLGCAESIYRLLDADDGIAMAGGLMNVKDPCSTAQKIRAIAQRVRGEV